MNYAKSYFFSAVSFGLLLLVSNQALAATISVPTDFVTVQAAINAASPGDTINIDNGNYAEALHITKSLTLIGQSETGVIFNTPDVNGYAVTVTGVNNVTLQNLTFNRPSVANCTPANTTACFGLKFAGSNGHTIDRVTVEGSPRTGIDFNGVDNSFITNVTVTNTIFGAGISLTDSDLNTLSNVTTSGNSFGGMALFTSTFYSPAGSENNVLNGTNSLAEPIKIYYQKTNAKDPISITATPEFNYLVLNNILGNETIGAFYSTLPEAVTAAENLEIALGNNAASNVVIQDLNNPATFYQDADPLTAGYQSGDILPPVLDELIIRAQDATDTDKAAIGGIFYLKDGEKILFSIKLDPADTVGLGNSFVGFDIGTLSVQTQNFITSAVPVTQRNRRYTILPGQEGAVGITGIDFKDLAGNDIVGLPGFPVSTNIVVDTTAPSITSVVQSTTNVNDRWAKEGEEVIYEITFSEAVTVTVNAPSTASNISALTQELDAVMSTTDELVFTAAAGDNGQVLATVDFTITDIAGNSTNVTALTPLSGGGFDGTIFTDTTIPTLNTVTIVSDNTNSSAWAKTGDDITLNLIGSERLLNGSVNVSMAAEGVVAVKQCGNLNCVSHTATLTTDGNEAEGEVPFIINFQDRAGNVGTAVSATTNGSTVTIDNTAPTVPVISIVSNNALNTALAKSNDTITVTFTVADNLATSASISGSPTILGNPAVANVTTVGAGQTISRFTDGSETSEVVVPFSFAVQDQAGNVSSTVTATTDASQVQFDRTEPVLRRVQLEAISADSSAFLGDAPTYYAKQNDRMVLRLQICDYIDSNTNPPTGTFFGQAVTLTDQGLVGAPGNCTTGAGNLSQWRRWRAVIDPADGVEGLVPFSIDPKDNAGNVLIPSVTVTTNGSSIIFDKTAPTVPTDMVDLGGAATLGFKPAADAALYTWTNDADPAGGTPQSDVYQFEVRYNNVNTGINEMVTITEPTRSFLPALMIPDLTPYTVNMNVRDKAGNASGEQVVYTQKYGIEISGTVVDADTGLPLEGVYVNAIASAGSSCNLPGQEVCSAATDVEGKYTMTVAPNTKYKLDATKAPTYYIAKSDLNVQNGNVTSNISLKHVAEGEIQTGYQGTILTMDAEFSVNGVPQTTYITAYSQSGEISTKVTPAGLEITSFGTVTGVTSNNPNVVIEKIGANTFLVKNAGNILNTTDNQNPGSSVSSTFASGSNRVGIRRAQGGSSAGFQAGIRREDRIVNNSGWTTAESMAFAQKLNAGSPYKVMQYVNRNGYTVFAGYQQGRLAIADMTGSNPNLKINKQILYRGPRRGTVENFRNGDMADRKEVIKNLFEVDEDKEPVALVVEEGNQQKAARAVTETKKTEFTYDNPDIAGFGRVKSVFPGVQNKRENDDRYVNKFARVAPAADVAPSRIQAKNVNMIVFKHNRKRSGEKLVLGQIFNENPQLITGRTRVVQR